MKFSTGIEWLEKDEFLNITKALEIEILLLPENRIFTYLIIKFCLFVL